MPILICHLPGYFKSAPWCIWSSSFQFKEKLPTPAGILAELDGGEQLRIPEWSHISSCHQATIRQMASPSLTTISLEGRCVCLSEIKGPKSARESFPQIFKASGGTGTIEPWDLETSTRHSSYGRSERCKIKHLFWVDPMFIQVFKTPPVYYRLLLS